MAPRRGPCRRSLYWTPWPDRRDDQIFRDTNTTMTDIAISQLLDLGLTASQARMALEATGGRVPEAIEWYSCSH